MTRVAAVRAHLARVAALDCCVCGRAGVEVHHVKLSAGQGRIDEIVVALCASCHRGSKNSAHGGGNFPTPYRLLARTFRALADAEPAP